MDVSKIVDLAKQIIAEATPPSSPAALVGIVIGFNYEGLAAFGDKSHQHIVFLVTGESTPRDFHFLKPPLTLKVGSMYSITVQQNIPLSSDYAYQRYDLLVSASELPS